MTDEGELPTVVAESKVDVRPGLSVRVLVLSNGQRIIPIEDAERFLEAMGINPLEIAGDVTYASDRRSRS